MTDRKSIEARIHLFMTNIRKGLSYDANVVLLAKDIEEAIKGETEKFICSFCKSDQTYLSEGDYVRTCLTCEKTARVNN